jgi:hypothetical protein
MAITGCSTGIETTPDKGAPLNRLTAFLAGAVCRDHPPQAIEGRYQAVYLGRGRACQSFIDKLHLPLDKMIILFFVFRPKRWARSMPHGCENPGFLGRAAG